MFQKMEYHATQDSIATDGAIATAAGSDDQREGNGSSSLTVGQITGIIIAVIVALTLLVTVVLAVVKCYCRR